MATDVQKSKGKLKRSSPTSGGSNPELVPKIGIVKNNSDSTRSGRIWVYISDNSGTDPEDSTCWRPVFFLSPFYGKTLNTAPNTGEGNFKGNTHSYGMWFSPPDIGTSVLCVFANGDLNFGYYIGCIPDPQALHMVPAIGSSTYIVPGSGEANKYGGATRLPVTNVNSSNKEITNTGKYLTEAKPVHRYVAATMWQQGILRDPIRGPISSSSQRENASRVGFGISTPGRPIYEGGFNDTNIVDNLTPDKADSLKIIGRRAGHSIVMDDGDVIGRDQLIRLRTADGHQITMSDDGQTIFIIHKNGQSYVELGKEGTVDIYSTNSINLRTQGDLNLHADNNLNIHAGKNLNIFAGEAMHVQSTKEFKLRAGADLSIFTTSIFTAKASGAMSLESTGDISMASSAKAFVNGSRVNLNSGKTGTTPKEVPAIDQVLHTDTLFDSAKGYVAAPAKLKSVTSRAPAHAPWTNAGQGVDIKSNLNAGSNLPSKPNTATSSINTAARNGGVTNPVSNATIAKTPVKQNISNAIDKNATQALSAQVATNAAAGPAADAVKKGATLVQNATGNSTVAIGQFAQTPKQLEQAGILKPGSSSLVDSLVASGSNIANAIPSTLFTGKPGAENLPAFINNIGAQQESLAKNLQIAQTKLQNAGAITGNESSTEIGGVILSAANNGVDNVLGSMQTSKLSDFLPGSGPNIQSFTNKLDQTLKDVSQGNFASKLGESAGGALDGLQSSLSAMFKSSLGNAKPTSQGTAADAFSAIVSSIPSLVPNKPQNLTAEATKSAEKTTAASVGNESQNLAQGLFGAATNIATDKLSSSVAKKLSGNSSDPLVSAVVLPLTNSLASSLIEAAKPKANVNVDTKNSVATLALGVTDPQTAAKNTADSVSGIKQAAQTVASGLISTTAATLASGVNNLPGGQDAVSTVNNLASLTQNIPNTNDLKVAIQNGATDAINNAQNTLGNNPTLQLINATASDVQALASKDGIEQLISAGLPAGKVAEVKNALSAITSQGSGVKMPSVGVNTNDRSSLEAGVKDALEDPGLPAPTYGEVDRETLDDKRKQKKKESDALYQTYLKKDEASQIAFNDFQDAQKAYDTAQKNLVQGSPELANLRQARDEKYSIYEKASLETDKALIDYENALTTNKTNKNTQPSNVIVTTGSPDNNLVVYRSVNEKGDEEIGWIENKSQTTTTTTSKRGS
jgi:hypothetical protein